MTVITCLEMIARSGIARQGRTLIADKGYRSAAIWHNQTTQQPGPARSLTAHDH